MEKINERLGNNEQKFQKDLDTRKDYWKTTFPDGVCSDHEKILKENIETFLRFKCTTWRYDYVFVTPLGTFGEWKVVGWINIILCNIRISTCWKLSYIDGKCYFRDYIYNVLEPPSNLCPTLLKNERCSSMF